jgi:hypothetical protein
MLALSLPLRDWKSYQVQYPISASSLQISDPETRNRTFTEPGAGTPKTANAE